MSDLACTHVLVWTPPYFLKGYREGYWVLFTSGDYQAGTVPDDTPLLDAPRDVSPLSVNGWLAEQLGHYSFALEYAEEDIRREGWFHRWHREPLYNVWQAAA